MDLTRESPRARWLILSAGGVFLAIVVVLHTLAMRDYVGLLDGLGRRGATELGTPLQRPLPTAFADTQTWIRHALTLLETDAWRIRFTTIDNAPLGREVHWNSAFAWTLAAEGWLRHRVTGEPLALAVERAAAWSNVPLLLGLAALFAWWTGRRAGAGAGLLVALAMVGHVEFYAGFAPNFADHHGILAVANFGIVLGLICMGVGWRRGENRAGGRLLPPSPRAAREGAIFSALSGAVGMWISAASVTPAIGIAGAAGLIATLWQGRWLRAQGAIFDAELWRLWGRVGAGASFFFYLLEYAPSHLGLRMEVNHPLYALAWWGGSELVASLCEWRVGAGGRAARPSWRVLGALAAVVAPAAVILVGGAAVFVIRDPMILQIAARVSEGLSLPHALRESGPTLLTQRIPWLAASLLPTGFLLWRGPRSERLLLAFGLLTCLAFCGLSVFHVRFFSNLGGPQICLVLMTLAVVTAAWTPRARWGVILAVAIGLSVPQRVQRLRETRASVARREVTALDVLQPLYRDIAATLRATQPAGDIVLLTNPDASTAIGYYGRLKTIGTLYWENLAGTKAAAAMSAATSWAEGRTLLQARGVTHVAVISESSFVREYYEMLHPQAAPGAWQQCLAYQLFLKQGIPVWLDEIAYEPPPDIKVADLRVVLFQTRFGNAKAESAFAIAVTQVRAGNQPGAARAIEEALTHDPAVAEYWFLKSELLLAEGQVAPALAAAEAGLRRASTQRAERAEALAGAFYQYPAHAAAVQLYRGSLETRYDPTTASNLGWVLATSPDATVRDGRTALALGERVAREDPGSYHFVSTLAAALAENGRFAEAAATANRALELIRPTQDAALIARAEARVRAYQAQQPWRQ